MTAATLIQKKRDGHELSRVEIDELIVRYMSGELADYQMSAMLMAMFLRGMSDAETVALMEAMLHSGTVLDLRQIPARKVDKHSTGGVGDKVSLCLAPLVAACGVAVPMISGRGLGHTGGTIDKLQSIPGFRTDLGTAEFTRIVGELGTCLISQTDEIAPADRRIYALRDVTATVESIPLIVASILSKKLAEGIDGLVLDVKVGRGAFMSTLPRARALAKALVRVGERAGKKVVALITDMNAPLGSSIGNALEAREAFELLAGRSPPDLLACTLALGREMLLLGGVCDNSRQAQARLLAAIADGSALERMERLVAAQGGDARVVRDPSRLPRAPLQVDVIAERSGFVSEIDARELGLLAVEIGAGRRRAEDPVDPAVGIELLVQRGERVRKGEPLARVHLRGPSPEAIARVQSAYRIAKTVPRPRPLVVARITARSR